MRHKCWHRPRPTQLAPSEASPEWQEPLITAYNAVLTTLNLTESLHQPGCLLPTRRSCWYCRT